LSNKLWIIDTDPIQDMDDTLAIIAVIQLFLARRAVGEDLDLCFISANEVPEKKRAKFIMAIIQTFSQLNEVNVFAGLETKKIDEAENPLVMPRMEPYILKDSNPNTAKIKNINDFFPFVSNHIANGGTVNYVCIAPMSNLEHLIRKLQDNNLSTQLSQIELTLLAGKMSPRQPCGKIKFSSDPQIISKMELATKLDHKPALVTYDNTFYFVGYDVNPDVLKLNLDSDSETIMKELFPESPDTLVPIEADDFNKVRSATSYTPIASEHNVTEDTKAAEKVFRSLNLFKNHRIIPATNAEYEPLSIIPKHPLFDWLDTADATGTLSAMAFVNLDNFLESIGKTYGYESCKPFDVLAVFAALFPNVQLFDYTSGLVRMNLDGEIDPYSGMNTDLDNKHYSVSMNYATRITSSVKFWEMLKKVYLLNTVSLQDKTDFLHAQDKPLSLSSAAGTFFGTEIASEKTSINIVNPLSNCDKTI
jgi:inosine-uridine nucleoside N-ribohydrolase